MMQRYLTISQLSKISHVSTDTLRYYDKIGLFKPEYTDEDTNYRYYSHAQCERISTIVELKNLGVSLKDIDEYMKHRNLTSSNELLLNLRKVLRSRITELSEIEKAIKEKLEIIESVQATYNDDTIEISYRKRRKILCIGDYIEKFEDGIYEQMKLEALYKHEPSIYAANNVGTLILPESLYDDERQALRRTPIMFVEKDDEKLLMNDAQQYIRYIEEGDFLCVTGHGRFRYSSDTAMKIRQYLYDNHYTISGSIVEHDLIDISITDNADEVVYIIEVPIKHNDKT